MHIHGISYVIMGPFLVCYSRGENKPSYYGIAYLMFILFAFPLFAFMRMHSFFHYGFVCISKKMDASNQYSRASWFTHGETFPSINADISFLFPFWITGEWSSTQFWGEDPMNSVRILQPRWYQSVRSFRSWFRKMGSTESKAALLASKEAEFIQQTVQDNCVVVFSKTTCGYCGMAKRVFSEIGTPYVAVELNKREDGAKLQDVLFAMTGESTVSNFMLLLFYCFISEAVFQLCFSYIRDCMRI